ncbi:hypothetical protein CLV59_106322 [Chitinophaga dinghuensis]|uniref:Uncharacterized protein n=1 Tax=Chitinophaga dinghuensis TaxID=1539050 RepID=A0A327VT74_9BACT|nr:hypothetical protein CLV59_106322 [Chitinophaga dinghuensis]
MSAHIYFLIAPAIKEITNITRKIKNRIFAMDAAPAAIPVKPKIAATIATTKKINVQRNISVSFLFTRIYSPKKNPSLTETFNNHSRLRKIGGTQCQSVFFIYTCFTREQFEVFTTNIKHYNCYNTAVYAAGDRSHGCFYGSDTG